MDMFVCLTETGKIARHLARQKPKQPILACSTNGQVVRQINQTRGVVGYKVPECLVQKTDDLIKMVLDVAQEQLICNLPSSKVLIYIGVNESNDKKALYNFKIIGGERGEDEEEEEEEEEDKEDDELEPETDQDA